MNKRIAIVIDKSGSMDLHTAYLGAGGISKIEEARDAARWLIFQLYNTRAGTDVYKITLWKFANGVAQIGSTTLFDSATTLGQMNAFRDQLNPLTTGLDASLGGVMTDIYEAVHVAADDIINDGQPGSKRVLFLFTDGNQTIAHSGTLDRAGYQTEAGLTFTQILDDRNIILYGVTIGSDGSLGTLTDLDSTGQAGSDSFDVNEAAGTTETEVSAAAAIMGSSLNTLLNNGMLPFAPVGEPLTARFSYSFQLPRKNQEGSDLVNHRDFEVVVDKLPVQLVFALTWRRKAFPRIVAVSPSGTSFQPGDPGTSFFTENSLFSFHVHDPEAGKWTARVHGDARLPLELVLMVRGINPRFEFPVAVDPAFLAAPDQVLVVARPTLDGKPATGSFKLVATTPSGQEVGLTQEPDGSFTGIASVKDNGRQRISVEMSGELDNVGWVQRHAFASVLVGPLRDPYIKLDPRVYQRGQSYTVDVSIGGASFDRATQLQFGDGIAVNAFAVLDGQRAIAEISVSNTAALGQRIAGTLRPTAETFTPFEVVEAGHGGRGGKGVLGRICCLRFDSTGKLIAIVLCDGSVIAVRRHEERLAKLLERARDQEQSVSIGLDPDGGFAWVDICR